MSEPAIAFVQTRPVTSPRLTKIREEIQLDDCRLISVILDRIDWAKKAGAEKARLELPIIDPAQEELVHTRFREMARTRSLPLPEIMEICDALISLCHKAQQNLIEGE